MLRGDECSSHHTVSADGSPKQGHSQQPADRKRGPAPEPAPKLDPIQTREYIKWKKRADKYIAKGQKEMFAMLEESFGRFFPSRREMERMQIGSTTGERGEPELSDTNSLPSKR